MVIPILTHRGVHLILPTVLYAYGDEHGLHENPMYCVVGGFIGAPGEWESFGPIWNATLAAYGINQGFHALEFFGGRSPYRDWHGDKRNAFLSSLLEILETHAIYPIATAVDVQAFRALPEAQRRYFTGAAIRTGVRLTESNLAIGGVMETSWKEMHGSAAQDQPYYVAAMHFLGQAINIAPDGCAVQVVLASHQTLSSGVLDYYNRRVQGEDRADGKSLACITFAKAKDTPELQLADMLVHLWGRYLSDPSKIVGRGKWALFRIGRARPRPPILTIADSDHFAHQWAEIIHHTNLVELEQGFRPSGDLLL